MYFYLNDERYKYELEKLTRIFLPFEKFQFVQNKDAFSNNDEFVFIETTENNNKLQLFTRVKFERYDVAKTKSLDVTNLSFTETERELALLLFDCFVEITGYTPPWGILTGVRPAKLIGRLISSYGEEDALNYFKNKLLVNAKKTDLCLECSKSEQKIVSKSTHDSFSLYISIPFCPSRCNYCSFVSHSVEQAKKLIPTYVELLCQEIAEAAKIANELNLKLKTVYMGGGTPTTLSAEQLTQVLNTVNNSFDMSLVEEFTVEAGRPDTVTEDKLLSIKNGGATRISINPQTMNDEVLKKIGRRHTVSDMINAFNLARKCGFDNINTDLIAGLDGDTFESFKASVDELIKLSPENVTVHSLSMKRASNLNKCDVVFDAKQGTEAEKMVDYAYYALSTNGIKPYYMYRQSKTVGNLENVGYSKLGYEGLYNVYIMDETHTILACGASAVTKLRQPGGNMIERIFNYKYPYEYINDFATILNRKQGIYEFYSKYGK